MRWKGLLLLAGAVVAAAILSSCGSTSTAVAPTITVSCVPTDVTVLGTAQCTATVVNLTSTLVNWSVSGTGNGSISSAGLYTAPATVPTNNVVTITATSQVQNTLTATQGLTIEQATAISAVTCVDPNSNSNVGVTVITSGNSLSCSATASTGAIIPVTWTVANTNKLGGNLGTISSQGGNYVAPLVPPPGQMVTITATTANSLSTMSVTVTVNFGNNVLSGSYVFSASGRLTNASNAFWARIGSFSAGGGTLTGTEDTNQGGSPNTVTTQQAFTGSYSIGTDGRGTMQFCENSSTACPFGSASATSFFRIVVVSPGQAHIIKFSSPSSGAADTTAGGEILSQNPLLLPNSANLSGVYSFNFSGVSTAAVEESIAGEFSANGFGTIAAGSVSPPAPGEMDTNAGGAVPLAGGGYSIGSNGRGTVALNGLNFSFYPVSAGRVKFLEIDTAAVGTPTTPAAILIGDAYKQQTSLNCGWGSSALNGLTVLESSGASSGVVVVDVGNFTAAAGALTSASLDENNGGTVSSQVGTLSGSYTLDADSCGRGTMTVGSHSYVFYVISPSFAVLQETTSGVVAHGLLLPSQGGPFTDSILTGSFAFRFGGTDAAGSPGLREDFVGQLTSAGSGTGVAGTLDFNDHGATQPGLAIANGTYLAAGGLRATMSVPIATSPATTRSWVLYMVSPTLFYALDTNPGGTALGAINNQF